MMGKTENKGEGAAEDEIVRQHQQISGNEFEQTPGDRRAEKSGMLQSIALQRVRLNLMTQQQQQYSTVNIISQKVN